jgi:hypothetical protein
MAILVSGNYLTVDIHSESVYIHNKKQKGILL